MPLSVSSEVFTNEWRECWKNPKRDLTNLLAMAQPFIEAWAIMLTCRDSEKNIHYVTLRSRLNSNYEIAGQRIASWVEWATRTTSVKEELELLFIEHVRTAQYFPTFAKATIAEFVIAQDYKGKLRYRISRVKQADIDYVEEEYILEELEYSPDYPDYLLLNNLNLDRWQTYLFELSKAGYSTLQISQIVHIPRETLYYEEKEIWHQLNKSFYEEA